MCIRCSHVVRDFESEAKTRSNFNFDKQDVIDLTKFSKMTNVQGLRSKFIRVAVDPLFFGQKNYKGLLFYQ